MSEEERNDLHTYEPPRALRFGDVAGGQGDCETGSGDWYCITGGQAFGSCVDAGNTAVCCSIPGNEGDNCKLECATDTGG